MKKETMVFIGLLIIIVASLCPLQSKQDNQDSYIIVNAKTKEFSAKYNYDGLFARGSGLPYLGRFKNLVTTDSVSFEVNCQAIINYIQQFYHIDSQISFVRNQNERISFNRLNGDSLGFWCSMGLSEYCYGFLIQKQPVFQPWSSISPRSNNAYLRIEYNNNDKIYRLAYNIYVLPNIPPKPDLTRQQAFETANKIAEQDVTASRDSKNDSQKQLYFVNQCLYVYHDKRDSLKYTYAYTFNRVTKIKDTIINKSGTIEIKDNNTYMIDADTGKRTDLQTINFEPYRGNNW